LPELPSAVKTFQHGLAAPYSRAEAPAAFKAPEYGSSAQQDAGGVPDGKVFFRTARARLAPQDFSAFLSSIKSLNAHTRTRAQTLADAEILFGPGNADLLVDFEALLAAHLA
jgi:hypothetical protein